MTQYIEKLPEPLKRIIKKNQCIPIIGTGFSMNAVLPKERTIPSWDNLGEILAKEVKTYEYQGNPLEAISEYCREFERPILIEELRKLLLIGEAKPGKPHFGLAQLKFDALLTTNYDTLLEESYSKLGMKYLPISNENILSVNPSENEVKIVKVHGDFSDPDRMIITKEDYDQYFENNPLFATHISCLLMSRTPLLIGYSFNDFNLLTIWEIIGRRLGKMRRQAYALRLNLTKEEEAAWREKGVTAINLGNDRSNYTEVLTKLFLEMRENIFKEKGDLIRDIKSASIDYLEGDISERK